MQRSVLNVLSLFSLVLVVYAVIVIFVFSPLVGVPLMLAWLITMVMSVKEDARCDELELDMSVRQFVLNFLSYGLFASLPVVAMVHTTRLPVPGYVQSILGYALLGSALMYVFHFLKWFWERSRPRHPSDPDDGEFASADLFSPKGGPGSGDYAEEERVAA